MVYLFSISNIWHDHIRASLHLMSKPDINAGNIFHSSDTFSVQNNFTGNSHSMPALYAQVSLPYLIFIGVQRISADIFQCFFQILPGHPIRKPISHPKKFLSISITEKYRPACPKPYFIESLIIHHTFFQQFPDISGKKILNLPSPDHPHLSAATNGHVPFTLIYVLGKNLVQKTFHSI